MLLSEQPDNLGSCPNSGAIAVGSHHVNGPMGVESGVKAHACTYANVHNLSLVVHCRLYGMPALQGHGTEGFGIDPTLIYGVCQTIGVDGGSRRFQIGIIAVEQLVLEARVVLAASQSGGMLPEKFDDGRTLWVVARQHVKHLA